MRDVKPFPRGRSMELDLFWNWNRSTLEVQSWLPETSNTELRIDGKYVFERQQMNLNGNIIE